MLSDHLRRPELNAGSMADIAFLLLIFFLVSTVIDQEIGILKKMHALQDSSGVIAERNLFHVEMNGVGDIMAEGEIIDIKDLYGFFVNHMYNPEGDEDRPAMVYRDPLGSSLAAFPAFKDEPMVLITYASTTPYQEYIDVQNEIRRGYGELRDRAFSQAVGIPSDLIDEQNPMHVMMYKEAHDAFPIRISEELRE